MVILCRPLLMLIAFGLLFAEAEFPPPIPGWRELTVQESTDRQQIANPQASVPKEAPEALHTAKEQAWQILETGGQS
jgi:uncharacterized protein YfaP (DUF2135 family)